MRKLFLILFFCGMLSAQNAGQVSITSTQCASISADQQGTVAIRVIGTWTGTLQPKISIAGQAVANIQVIPSTSSTPQNTITANGGYTGNVAGYSTFMLCGASVSSGTAKVYLNISPKSR